MRAHIRKRRTGGKRIDGQENRGPARAGTGMGARGYTLILIAGIAAGCAATPGEMPTSLMQPPLGTQFTEAVTIANKRVPLPSGLWTVIGTQIEKNGERGYRTVNMLAKIKDKSVLAAVEIYTNLPVRKKSVGGVFSGNNAPKGWLTVRSCTRDDMHFLKVYANSSLGDQDCWWVNHRRMDGPPDTGHWQESRKYLAENQISAPLDMITVSFRLADQADYLTVNYFFNTETTGLEPAQDVNWKVHTWKTSDWHPDQVKDDPKKRQYIQNLISWGDRWHKKIKASFGLK